MTGVDGLWSDLLTKALGMVDWYEIAESLIEEVDKGAEEEEETS
jgi:hypothetical protein